MSDRVGNGVLRIARIPSAKGRSAGRYERADQGARIQERPRCAEPGSSSGASIMRGKQQESNARESTRTDRDAGVGRLSRKVSGPSGVLVEIVTPVSRGVAGTPEGRGCVMIVTAISPAGPSRLALSTLPASFAVFKGLPCGFQPSWPASHAASQLAIRGGRAESGERASICRALMRFKLCGLHGGSKNWATSSRQRARPNQALSRLLGHRLCSSPSLNASASAPGSGRSRTSRAHSSARS